MKCPACFSELSSVTIGQLTVDMCRGGCGGTWFDAFELQQVDESHESAGQWLVNIERDPHLHVDSSRKRACPKCSGVKLKRRYNLDAPKGVNGRNSDNTLIEKVFGWEPSTKLRDGLEVTYRWIYDQMASKAKSK